MSVSLTHAECANCDHAWTAIVEDPDLVFGLECSACGEMRGRLVGPRSFFATVEEAQAFVDPPLAVVVPFMPR